MAEMICPVCALSFKGKTIDGHYSVWQSYSKMTVSKKVTTLHTVMGPMLTSLGWAWAALALSPTAMDTVASVAIARAMILRMMEVLSPVWWISSQSWVLA
jgi:hypothetical protein